MEKRSFAALAFGLGLQRLGDSCHSSALMGQGCGKSLPFCLTEM